MGGVSQNTWSTARPVRPSGAFAKAGGFDTTKKLEPFELGWQNQFTGTLGKKSVTLDLAIAASFFACTVASVNALVRVVFCMGREGVAPRALGNAHSRFQTPAAAIVAAMAIITVAPIAVLLAGTAPDSAMRIFLALGACGYLGSYLTGCIAAPVLLHRIGESTTAAVVLSVTTTVILSALFGNAIYFAVRDGAGLLGIYGALISIGLLYTIGLKIFAPQRVNAVGIYDETQRADLLNSVPFR